VTVDLEVASRGDKQRRCQPDKVSRYSQRTRTIRQNFEDYLLRSQIEILSLGLSTYD